MSAAEKTSPAPDAPMIEFALDYARRGWPAFPCKPTDKSPYIKGGLKAATTNQETICRWWQRWPRAMIGVPMGSRSGVWAVDPDPPKKPGDPDGRVVWAGLLREHGKLPATHTEVTPRGGQHVLFKWDPDRPVTNSPGGLGGQNIDVRGEGGYVIMAPSVCADGGRYSIVEPLDFFHFAIAPDWVYELVLRPEKKPSTAAATPPHIQQPYTSSSPSFGKNEFWHKVNSIAFQRLDAWVPEIFGSAARFEPGTGAYRISSRNLGRDLEEDLSISPLGAKDWGVWDIGDAKRGKRSAIDIVIEYGGKRDAAKAALWLCERCGVDPATLGWNPAGHGGQSADEPRSKTSGQGQSEQQTQASPFELFWHGEEYNRPQRSWLVKELIPEVGHGLASGQWGTAKTFCMIDLAASIMTGTPFAGREICRRGGVLFIAAEGASEIPIRLQGVVEHKLRPAAFASAAIGQPISADLESLPFAWIEACPNLQDNGNFNQLVGAARQAAQNIRNRFGLPLALIIIDTLSAAGNFEDANDAAEGQFIMNRLGELSRLTGAFALAVDHFGKAVETGTRGTSAKEAAADVVLALLADRETNGTLSKTRMAVRKLRGGKTGTETLFDLRVVDLGEGETTCVIEWKADRVPVQASTAAENRWPRSLRIFQVAMTTALLDHGKQMRPFGSDGPTVRAVPDSALRREFVAAYPAEASPAEAKGNAKRMAFTRALKQARDRELVCSREIDGIDYLWLVERNEDKPHTTAHNPHTP